MLEKESDSNDLILDYYKDWDSSTAPVLLVFDSSSEFTESIENVDEKKNGALKEKVLVKIIP
ncbi:unnamed protein product [marine sediment metagenome]|uniref:Uncharacterized protein n=1 Tax=marine sediment metagenome TaxID=412755 RepID=X1AJ22_9ZZZZ